MLGVDRARSGHRRYSEHDPGWIELITKLRATGMPIGEVRRSPSWSGRSRATRRRGSNCLRAHREPVRAQLETMAVYLEAIDVKISFYADAIETCQSSDGYLSSPSPAAAAARG
jgi:DNA-binding transcriptional MerR regulator